jgi:hypothetical protein
MKKNELIIFNISMLISMLLIGIYVGSKVIGDVSYVTYFIPLALLIELVSLKLYGKKFYELKKSLK